MKRYLLIPLLTALFLNGCFYTGHDHDRDHHDDWHDHPDYDHR